MKPRHRWAIIITAGVALAPMLQSHNQPWAFLFMVAVSVLITWLVVYE